MSKFLTTAAAAAAAAALVAGGLSAQTKYVSPSMFAKKVGNYNQYLPFVVNRTAIYRNCRMQEIMDLPASAKGKLSAIAFRTGLTHASRGAPPAFSATLEVTVSTAGTTAGTVSGSFASNAGTNATVVVAKKIVKFAKYPLLPKFPQPFFFKIPFDANKVLVVTGGKSLCLDMRQYDNTLYNATTNKYEYFYTDGVSFSSGYGLTNHSGRPCFSSNPGTFLPYYGYSYANVRTYGTGAGNLQAYAYAYNGPRSGLAVHMLTGGKMPVGIPLGGGCSLYVNLGTIIAMTPSPTDSRGYVRFPAYVSGKPTTYIFDTPWQKSWAGATLYGQSFAFDSKANSTGVISTQLNTIQLPLYMKTGYPVSYVYRTNYSGQTTGFARKGYGRVIELSL